MSTETSEIIKNEEKSLPIKENTTESNDKNYNSNFISILHHFTDFLTKHSVYEAIPENAKVLVFNSDLCLKEMIKAFINEDIYCALIYDSSKQIFIGIITISDVLSLFTYITEKSKGNEITDISLFIKELFSEKKLPKKEEESKKRNESKSIDILKHLDKINFKDYNKYILKKKSLQKNLISVSLDSPLLEVVKLIHKEGVHRIIVEETKKKKIDNKKSKDKNENENEEIPSPEKKDKLRTSMKLNKKSKTGDLKKEEDTLKNDDEKKLKKKKLVKKKKIEDAEKNNDDKDNNDTIESVESPTKGGARKVRLKKKTVTTIEKNTIEDNNATEEKTEKSDKDNLNMRPKSSRLKKNLTKKDTIPESKEEEDKKEGIKNNNVDKKENSEKAKTKKKIITEDNNNEKESSEIQNYTGFITYETVFDFFIFNYYSKEMKEFNMTLNDLITMENNNFVQSCDVFSKKVIKFIYHLNKK